eukprot:Seg1430.3 transcript_id=Seg1430.3/GoldUCD/mRNA.D3Y31 product="hypothetical protein" protein_id=Seg1430.3/GoldUCD/D3Y31
MTRTSESGSGFTLRNDGRFPIYTAYNGSIPFRGSGIGSSIRSGLKSLIPSGLTFAREVILPEAFNVAKRVARGESLKDVGKEALKRTGKKLGKRVLAGTKRRLLGESSAPPPPKKKKKGFIGGRRKATSIKGTTIRLSKSDRARLRQGVAKALKKL